MDVIGCWANCRCHIERLSMGDDVLIECEENGQSVFYEARVKQIFTHLGMYILRLHMHFI